MTRRWFARVSCALLLAGVSLTATAPPAPAVSTLKVEAGYGGFILPGRSFPVRVEARTDRLVRGRIEVIARSDNGPGDSVAVRLPVEVPGGGAKSFVVVVPPIVSFPGSSIGVDARLLEGDGGSLIAESDRVRTRPADDRELVGLLPGAAGAKLPATVPLAIDAGVADFFAVDAVLLDLAPGSLEPLGTLVAGGGELGRVTPPVQRRVFAWLERGGTLLVDAPTGSAVEGLPEEWQPGDGGTSPAGLGQVRLVPGVVAGGNWEGVIFPTPSRARSDPRFGGFGGGMPVGNSLADDAGLRVPQLRWLLGFLLVYTAIVGPVFGIVLNKRKRSELAWLLVPLAALVFAGGSYTAARGLRGGTRLAHGSVIELSPAGASATSFIGVAARDRQTTDVGLGGESWEAGRSASGFDGRQRSDIEMTESGPHTELRLSAGQFAVASLRAPVPSPGEIRMTATSSEDGVVEGTVRNDLDTALDEVLVLVGSNGMNVGRLEPGDEREWTTRSLGLQDHQEFPIPEMSLWRDASGQFGPPDPKSPVNFSVWQSAVPGGGIRPAGLATAVGWTRDARLPIRIDGRERSAKGSTAMTTSVPIVPRGRVTDMTVRGEMLRGSENFGGEAGGSLGRVARFVLPTGSQLTRDLMASVPAFAGGVEVWDGRGWVSTAGAPPGNPEVPGQVPLDFRGRPGPAIAVPAPMPPQEMGPMGPQGPVLGIAIPRSVVVAGSVFLRFAQSVPPGQGALLLREVA